MDDVFLFMKLGNDTTKQLMATGSRVYNCCSKFGYLRFEPFANRFGEENPLYAMGFMREKSQKSKWAAYQRGIFFWQAVTLVLAIMSQNCIYIVTAVCVQRFWNCSCVYVQLFTYFLCLFLVILIGYVVTWSYYMLTYHRSFRYYAGRDKVWKPFSFCGSGSLLCLAEWAEGFTTDLCKYISIWRRWPCKRKYKEILCSGWLWKRAGIRFFRSGKCCFL